jgi:hypothetical protein
MHTPVAAVPGVAHLVPSVAPLAHTNETKASSSPQRTVSVPVTRRKGGAGAGSPLARPEARQDLAVRQADPVRLLGRRTLVDPARVGRSPRLPAEDGKTV